jgi:hypothetical protein
MDGPRVSDYRRASSIEVVSISYLILSSCGAALWRFGSIVKINAGISADLSWNLVEPTLLSFAEIYIACISASTPFSSQ